MRPLDALARAAERVALGARRFSVPQGGARELVELGANLHIMTEHLIREEERCAPRWTKVERATVSLKEHRTASFAPSAWLRSVALAAGLAHEVGNPIAALLGLEDLLLEGGLDPSETQDFLQRMRKETERIHRILRDLLQFARPAENRELVGATHGSVAEAVADTVALIAPQKAMRDIELELDVPSDLPGGFVERRTAHAARLESALERGRRARRRRAGARVGRARTSWRAPRGRRQRARCGGAVRERLFEPFVTTKDIGKGDRARACRLSRLGRGGSAAVSPSTWPRRRARVSSSNCPRRARDCSAVRHGGSAAA